MKQNYNSFQKSLNLHLIFHKNLIMFPSSFLRRPQGIFFLKISNIYYNITLQSNFSSIKCSKISVHFLESFLSHFGIFCSLRNLHAEFKNLSN